MEFKKYKLSELASVDISGVDKKSYEGEKPVRLCNFTDVYKNWAITEYHYPSLMKATAKDRDIEKFKIKKGQVAITKDSETRDDIGIPTYIADNFEDVILGYHCALITPSDALDGKYLNAYLNTKMAKKYFEGYASGSGQRYTLTLDSINDIQIWMPDIEDQKKLSKILNDIDRKIALNTRMNVELEAMAKQLYDYWFVQFDFPDENGKPYKSSGGKMVYNPTLKREIPAGWDNCEIKDLSEVVNGATPLTTNLDYYGNDIIWITPNDLSNQKAKFISCGERSLTQMGYDSCSTTLMPAGSVLMSSRAPIGLLTIAEVELCTNQGFKSFVPFDMTDNYFLYYYIKEHMAQIEQLGAGTTFREVSRDTMLKFPILKISDREIYAKWYEQIDSICKEQKNLLRQIRHLIPLRDSLLPMLMNGQVTVEQE